MAVSTDDLLHILGLKEATIYDLSRENAKLRSELNLAAAKTLPTPLPPNVVPFPPAVPNVKTD